MTTMLRPSKSVPLSAEIARCASSSELISTKPKPFERPLNLSVMIRALTTLPCLAKCSCSFASTMEYGRFPTYNLAPILPHPPSRRACVEFLQLLGPVKNGASLAAIRVLVKPGLVGGNEVDRERTRLNPRQTHIY